MFNIITKRFWYFLISIIVIVVCVVSLATFRLKPGIEFSSGSVMTVGFEQQLETAELQQALADSGYASAIIQQIGDEDFLIRLPKLGSGDKTELEASLSSAFNSIVVKEFDSVSPMVATETTRDAAIAVAVAGIGILLYIAWAFRKMPNPFRYGLCALVALTHDALIALGVFSILGGLLDWEIDLMFLTGILAVIGYSVNNTVVVFDRIRENLLKGERFDFETVVNSSLVETLSRSLNTSLTTLFVVLALLLFIGTAIQNFAVVLLVGIFAGTYSSLFIAPSLLVVWQKREWRRFIPGLPMADGKAGGR
ncbi:protein translocase subunit SecF [Chloroflexota bacterium]